MTRQYATHNDNDTPKVAIFGALSRYVYSDIFFYTQVGVALLCGCIF